jgi:hypothetical protein
VLTQREREKLSLVIQDPTIPEQPLPEDRATISHKGDYMGLTDNEIMKLHQIHKAKTIPRPSSDGKPISTIEMVPRVSGSRGMTEDEKAKLEAWKKARAKTPRTSLSD